jgi:hypothetical protein
MNTAMAEMDGGRLMRIEQLDNDRRWWPSNKCDAGEPGGKEAMGGSHVAFGALQLHSE